MPEYEEIDVVTGAVVMCPHEISEVKEWGDNPTLPCGCVFDEIVQGDAVIKDVSWFSGMDSDVEVPDA